MKFTCGIYIWCILCSILVLKSDLSYSQKAILFNDDDGYVAFGERPELDVRQITIEAWIKLNDAKSGVILAKPGAYYLRVHDGLILDAGIYDQQTDARWHTISGSTALTPGTYYHVAFSYNGDELILYLNGRTENKIEHRGSIDPLLTNGVFAGSQFFIDDYEDYASPTDDTKIYVHENYSTHRPPTALQRVDIEKNRYHFSGDNDQDNVADEAISYIKDLKFVDYIVEVDERWSQQEGNAYISQRFLDVRDKYEIAIDPEWNQIWINKVVNNVWAPLATSTKIPVINNDTWYTIRSKISTIDSINYIEAWVNGVRYLESNDADLFYDSLAILVHDHDAEDFSYDIYFDNLQVFIPFKGIIDELRIFNKAVGHDSILSWMCREIDDNSDYRADLCGYWHFDDEADPTADFSKNSNGGDLINVTYDSSKFPSDFTNIYTRGNTSISATVEVSADLIWDGDGPGADAVTNIMQIRDVPVSTNGLSGEHAQLYWEIFIENDDGSFNAEVRFHYDHIKTLSDELNLVLYTRANSDQSWRIDSNFKIFPGDSRRDGIGYIKTKVTQPFQQFILTGLSKK